MKFRNKEKKAGCECPPFWERRLANILWLIARLREVAANEGAFACFRKAFIKLLAIIAGHSSALPFSSQEQGERYKVWRKKHVPSSESLRRMRTEAEELFEPQIMTVVLPVSSTDEEGLRQTIASLRQQTYPHWRLLVVGDMSGRSTLETQVAHASEEDNRIRFKIISELDNAAEYVLGEASGDFVIFLSEDCYLAPEAIYAVVMQIQECPHLDFLYSDEDTARKNGTLVDPFFKPGWSPDLLIGMNYVGRFCVMRAKILAAIRESWGDMWHDGLYHLVLRYTEETNKVGHIPKVLCHCRAVNERPSNHDHLRAKAQMNSLRGALYRRNEHAEVVSAMSDKCRVVFQISDAPLVSIIIPTKDRSDLLRQCIQSIEQLTAYSRYEIIVIDNDSHAWSAQEYLAEVSTRWAVHQFSGTFNFSSINNYGASKARGEFLLFLNDDTQVVSPDWLSVMMAQGQRSGVGVVGAKLLYSSGRIQHAGVVLGIRGIAGHAFRHLRGDREYYHGLCSVMRNCSAVTAACALVSAKTFQKIGGFETRLKVEYNDVDLCLRLIREGYRIIYTPEAVLIHHENASRRGRRDPEDEEFFLSRWGESIRQGDPYYNPHLSCSKEDWSIQV